MREKRDGCAMKMVSALFLFWLQNLFVLLVLAEQNDTLTKDKIPRLEPENIRESILDFTAHLGEINPDMPYLCRRGQSGIQRAVFAFSPLFGESR